MAALARVERTDFLSPMCIGEVANVSAEITYTSRHSVEVQVNVMSENILTGGWVAAGGCVPGITVLSQELEAVTPSSAPSLAGRSGVFVDRAGGAGRAGAGEGGQAGSLGFMAPL